MNTTIISGQKKSIRRNALSRFLANVSLAWKMGMMVSVLILGMLGIATVAYFGAQSLLNQLSNIYGFMLVPIVEINNADVALADAQFNILQSQNTNFSMAERVKMAEDLIPKNKLARDVITRYNNEWVTTTSLEFTKSLRDAGKLDLQKQELAALASVNTSLDAYQKSFEKFLTTTQSGSLDVTQANESIANLQTARANLETLIEINNQFADFSNNLALATHQQVILNNGIVLALSIIFGLFMSYLIVVSITSRLGDLTRSAAVIQQGNFDEFVATEGQDEISLLGSAFNSMLSQLKDLFSSLEQRIAARTQDLATVAEVGTATATILDTNRLLQEVVDLTKERFNLYHSHIYLLDEAGENLVLASGAGEPGRQMVAEGRSIPLSREQSLVARAARERKGVTVNDVTQAPDFLPNPLLPDTRSELAVPMIVGEKVIGVFDIQSDQVGRFTESDVNIQTTLAAQVATSIQNVRSFEQSKSQADLESLVNAIGQKIQRTTTVEDTLQIAIRELGMALGAARVSANIQAGRQHDGDDFSRN